MRLGDASGLPRHRRGRGPGVLRLGIAVALVAAVTAVVVVQRRGARTSPVVPARTTPVPRPAGTAALPRRDVPTAAPPTVPQAGAGNVPGDVPALPPPFAPPGGGTAGLPSLTAPVTPASREVLAEVLAGLQSHL